MSSPAIEIQIAIARLDGFLNAFEWINHKVDFQCTFYAVQLPDTGSVEEALATYFKAQASAFTIRHMTPFDSELRQLFKRNLLMFQDPKDHHLADHGNNFWLFDEMGQDNMLEEITGVFRALQATAGWHVTFPDELSEACFQADVVLKLPGCRCLLHFGVTD